MMHDARIYHARAKQKTPIMKRGLYGLFCRTGYSRAEQQNTTEDKTVKHNKTKQNTTERRKQKVAEQKRVEIFNYNPREFSF
jgi:hypothetical protein